MCYDDDGMGQDIIHHSLTHSLTAERLVNRLDRRRWKKKIERGTERLVILSSCCVTCTIVRGAKMVNIKTTMAVADEAIQSVTYYISALLSQMLANHARFNCRSSICSIRSQSKVKLDPGQEVYWDDGLFELRNNPIIVLAVCRALSEQR